MLISKKIVISSHKITIKETIKTNNPYSNINPYLNSSVKRIALVKI
jgi:hypothetical protein